MSGPKFQTGDEFLAWFARQRGTTAAELLSAGYDAEECGPGCDYADCRGWVLSLGPHGAPLPGNPPGMVITMRRVASGADPGADRGSRK